MWNFGLLVLPKEGIVLSAISGLEGISRVIEHDEDGAADDVLYYQSASTAESSATPGRSGMRPWVSGTPTTIRYSLLQGAH